MTVNVRTKGQTGEREVASILNKIVDEVRVEEGFGETIPKPFQRNQMQTAIGGSDLTNPFQLSIEVKRQQALSINTWWKQCVYSANQEGGLPILLFRQNNKKWRAIMYCGDVLGVGCDNHCIKVELMFDDFKQWFKTYYRNLLLKSE